MQHHWFERCLRGTTRYLQGGRSLQHELKKRSSSSRKKGKAAEDFPTMEVQTWIREDAAAQCYRTTASSGPSWHRVVRRCSVCLSSGTILSDLCSERDPKAEAARVAAFPPTEAHPDHSELRVSRS
mmetsp:Transcript_1054/g.2390  ORF Transcript_1054/g.2390 Transcript_1054/m.2390 type:complete len:126 (+) Transcript_1054:473-850(+)